MTAGPFIKKLLVLFGPATIMLMPAGVAVGIVTGLMEILFGAATYNFLAKSGFAPVDSDRLVVPYMDFFDPAFLLVGLGMGLALLRFGSSAIALLMSELIEGRVRYGLARRTLVGVREAKTLPLADITHIVSNLGPRSSSWAQSLVHGIVSLCLLMTLSIGLLTLSFELTAISIAAGAFMAMPYLFTHRQFSNHSEQYYQSMTQYVRNLTKDAKHSHFLKVIGANEYAFRKLSTIVSSIRRHFIRYAALSSAYLALPTLLAVCLVVFVVTINSEVEKPLSVSLLVPFLYLLYRLAGGVSAVLSAISQLVHNRPFIIEMAEFADVLLGPDMNDGVKFGYKGLSSVESLRVKDLSIGREAPILSKLNFALSKGETLVITGQSGVGKTTLLMTLIGLIGRCEGEILWNGYSVDDISPDSFRPLVGYVGPDPYLINGTIRQNLTFGLEDEDIGNEEVEEALTQMSGAFVNNLPGNMFYELQDDGEGISAGQKQRIALARSILRRPQILLLDEATSNIDEETEKTIMQNLRTKLPDTIIIAISHRKSVLNYANCTLSLSND